MYTDSLFQSPIGTQKTVVVTKKQFAWISFQSPIGTQKTLEVVEENRNGL